MRDLIRNHSGLLLRISSLLLVLPTSGCAVIGCMIDPDCLVSTTRQSVVNSTPKLDPAMKMRSSTAVDCQRVETDLSVPVSQRAYRCRTANGSLVPIHTVITVGAPIRSQRNEVPVVTAQQRNSATLQTWPRKAVKVSNIRIPFGTGRYRLGPMGKAKVNSVLPATRSAQRITVQGLASSGGNVPANDALALQRASSVSDALVDGGVSRDRLNIVPRDRAISDKAVVLQMEFSK